MRRSSSSVPLLLTSLAVACGGKAADSGPAAAEPDYREVGPHAVGVAVQTLDSLPVLVWAPADRAGDPTPLELLTTSAERQSTLLGLLEAAPTGCPTSTLPATLDAPLADGPWPLVALSHCHECTANSLASVAAHLASWGRVVVAPSHEGNTLYDGLADSGLPLDSDTLALRGSQLEAAIAAARSGELGVAVSEELSLVGHSFGAVTVGLRSQVEPVPTVFLGAPADNPLIPGVDAADLRGETTWLLLEEDNSIGLPGNLLLESNAAEVTGPTRLVRYPEAGHWSVSDIVGLVEEFRPGCGEDTRQDGSGEVFAYPEPELARAVTAGVVATALFGGVDALDALDGWQTLGVERP